MKIPKKAEAEICRKLAENLQISSDEISDILERYGVREDDQALQRSYRKRLGQQLARIVDYDPRHLQAIENEGQKPSLELLIQLVTMFGVSVDEYIFPDNEVKRSSVRRRLDAELDKLNDKELSIVEATVSGLCKAKEPEE